MKNTDLIIDGKKVTGLEVPLPGAPLVLAYGTGGFVMCGYLSIETANKLGVAAALVRGVNTVEELLAAKVQGVSNAAAEKGVAIGDVGHDALARLV